MKCNQKLRFHSEEEMLRCSEAHSDDASRNQPIRGSQQLSKDLRWAKQQSSNPISVVNSPQIYWYLKQKLQFHTNSSYHDKLYQGLASTAVREIFFTGELPVKEQLSGLAHVQKSTYMNVSVKTPESSQSTLKFPPTPPQHFYHCVHVHNTVQALIIASLYCLSV